MRLDRLGELRRRSGLSLDKTAELLFVSRPTLQSWIRGESQPSSGALIRMAEHYCVSVDYILERDADNVTPYELILRAEEILRRQKNEESS